MNITALLIYIAVMSVTPGPHNLMCLYLGANKGFSGTLPFMCSSLTSLFVKCVLCGLLNFILAEKIPALIPYLKWIGFAYMLYLAVSMIISAVKKKENKEQSGEGSVRDGIMLQVLNIKSWVAALSIFSVYVMPYTTALGTILLVALTFTLFCAAASIIWCGCGTAIQGLYRRYRLAVSCILAAALIVCAISAIV